MYPTQLLPPPPSPLSDLPTELRAIIFSYISHSAVERMEDLAMGAMCDDDSHLHRPYVMVVEESAWRKRIEVALGITLPYEGEDVPHSDPYRVMYYITTSVLGMYNNELCTNVFRTTPNILAKALVKMHIPLPRAIVTILYRMVGVTWDSVSTMVAADCLVMAVRGRRWCPTYSRGTCCTIEALVGLYRRHEGEDSPNGTIAYLQHMLGLSTLHIASHEGSSMPHPLGLTRVLSAVLYVGWRDYVDPSDLPLGSTDDRYALLSLFTDDELVAAIRHVGRNDDPVGRVIVHKVIVDLVDLGRDVVTVKKGWKFVMEDQR